MMCMIRMVCVMEVTRKLHFLGNTLSHVRVDLTPGPCDVAARTLNMFRVYSIHSDGLGFI